ncbi:MAG: GGDEF domain-containing protein [Pseudorhodoplanes sp.]
MLLDLPTLFLVSTCITALLGVFLFVLWLQDRSVRALGYWASAYLIGGFAVALWVVSPDWMPAGGADLANALLFICCGLIWSGARKFHGRSAMTGAAISGAMVWLVAARMPELIDVPSARVVISSLIITTYAVLTAIELRRERRKPRSGKANRVRGALIPLLHGVIFLSPILTTTLFAGNGSLAGGMFPLFALLTLLYVVGTAFIVVVMAKEHSALVHRTAAMTDHLTGMYNRRGFLEAAEKLIETQRKLGQPVSVMMFDLDHFKSINDRFGHEVGDEALLAFASTASSSMRIHDIIGRMGGEEFAAILPGGTETATLVGERVRANFEVSGAEIAGHFMNATVSIGIAESSADVAKISTLLSRADRALYAAKASGRNRVCNEREARTAPAEAPPLAPKVPTEASHGIAAGAIPAMQ